MNASGKTTRRAPRLDASAIRSDARSTVAGVSSNTEDDCTTAAVSVLGMAFSGSGYARVSIIRDPASKQKAIPDDRMRHLFRAGKPAR